MCRAHPPDASSLNTESKAWAGVIGICSVGAGSLFFSLVGSAAKWVDINPLFYMAVRSPGETVLATLALLFLWRSRGFTGGGELFLGKSDDRRSTALVLLRSLASWLTSTLYVLSLTLMPVGDATAIVYAFEPMLNGLFSRWLLGEPLLVRTWLTFFGNVGGTILIVQPFFLFGSPKMLNQLTYWQGLAAAVAATLFAGLLPVLTRLLKHWHWASLLHNVAVLSSFVLTPASLVVFRFARPTEFSEAWAEVLCVLQRQASQCLPAADGSPRPRPGALAVLICVPLLSVAATTLYTYGYQVAKHSHTANLLSYSEIPLAFFLQHTIFGDEVNALDIIGSLVILSLSVITVFFESREVYERSMQEDYESGTAASQPDGRPLLQFSEELL